MNDQTWETRRTQLLARATVNYEKIREEKHQAMEKPPCTSFEARVRRWRSSNVNSGAAMFVAQLAQMTQAELEAFVGQYPEFFREVGNTPSINL